MKCEFCKRNATFVNEMHGAKRQLWEKIDIPNRGRLKFQIFEIQKATPQSHHNIKVSTAKFNNYLLNNLGVITTALGSI